MDRLPSLLASVIIAAVSIAQTGSAAPVDVSADEDAEADLLALSVFGNSTAGYVCAPDGECVRGFAVSGSGDADSSTFCREIPYPHTSCLGGGAISVFGDAQAVGHAAISVWGDAANCCDLTASVFGDSSGGIMVTSLAGDAAGLSAVSVFGDASAVRGQCYVWVIVYPLVYCAGSYAVSVFGDADGDQALSVCGEARRYFSCPGRRVLP